MPPSSKVIGELSVEESEALKALLTLGTCVISDTGGPVLNKATTSRTSRDQSEKLDYQTHTVNPTSSIPTIPTPSSEHIQSDHTPSDDPEREGTLSEETILDILNNQPRVILQRCQVPKKGKTSANGDEGIFPTKKTAAQFKLRIQTHHLKRKRKCKYYFKCAVPDCGRSFNSVKSWNIHHLAKHKNITYRCGKCRKMLHTLTSMKSHELTHHDKPHTCGQCGKTFLHLSKLNLHRHLHRRQ